MKIRTLLAVVNGLILSVLFLPTNAQTNEEITKIILHRDSLFWNTYNQCDIIKNKEFLTHDIEFYHDKGGITSGDSALAASIKNNLCSNPDFKIRREPVQGTIHVFPMRNNAGIYGAVISGEHLFYVKEKNRNERLEGQARFTHLWILQGSSWKMKRILSYDHGPAVYVNKRKAMLVSSVMLKKFVGKYKSQKAGDLTVTANHDHLIMQIGNNEHVLFPESKVLFFSKERDLTFLFKQNNKGKATELLIYENGDLVERASFINL